MITNGHIEEILINANCRINTFSNNERYYEIDNNYCFSFSKETNEWSVIYYNEVNCSYHRQEMSNETTKDFIFGIVGNRIREVRINKILNND